MGKMFNYVTAPNPKDHINTLSREEQISIFRLRISQRVKIGAVDD